MSEEVDTLIDHEDHTRAVSPTISGVARVDANARKLAARLEHGEIAVIDFRDLDRATAQAFVAAGANAVLNAAPSMSGRYPTLGPLVLLDAGIALLDDLGADIMTVKDGSTLSIVGQEVTQSGRIVATGQRITLETAREVTEASREGFATHIQTFAATTGEYLEREGALLISGSGMPELSHDLRGKVVLLVLDDADAPAQLRKARAWIRDTDPFIIAVDGGAALARDAGLKPAIIVGDMELIPEKLLRSDAELVVGTHSQYAKGVERLKRMGLSHHSVSTTSSAADLAVLLATYGHAKAIVTAGEHTTFDDFFDRGRTGMAAAFFTRLRAGGKLIPLPVVQATYKPRIRLGSFLALIAAAALALGTALVTTPLGHDILDRGVGFFTQQVDESASAGAAQ